MSICGFNSVLCFCVWMSAWWKHLEDCSYVSSPEHLWLKQRKQKFKRLLLKLGTVLYLCSRLSSLVPFTGEIEKLISYNIDEPPIPKSSMYLRKGIPGCDWINLYLCNILFLYENNLTSVAVVPFSLSCYLEYIIMRTSFPSVQSDKEILLQTQGRLCPRWEQQI